MSSIFGKALAGAGTGLVQSGLMAYKDQLEAAREGRLAALQEARDARLYAHQDELQQKTQEFTAGESQKTRDTTVSEAEKTRELTRGEGAATRGTQKEIAELHETAANKRHGQSMGAQSATNARLDKELGLRQQEFDIKKKVATIELDNLNKIEGLKADYENASTPEEKATIRDTISLLRGKDVSDNWIVTGINPDPMTGRATEYIKINKTTGAEQPIGLGKGAKSDGGADPLGIRKPSEAPKSGGGLISGNIEDASLAELQRMAKRPKGVSPAEASEAAAEIEKRKGQPRMSAF